MITREEYLKANKIIELYRQQLINELSQINVLNIETEINKTDLSIRALNILKSVIENKDDFTFLSVYKELKNTPLSKLRGAGKSTQKEIKDLFHSVGLELNY